MGYHVYLYKKLNPQPTKEEIINSLLTKWYDSVLEIPYDFYNVAFSENLYLERIYNILQENLLKRMNELDKELKELYYINFGKFYHSELDCFYTSEDCIDYIFRCGRLPDDSENDTIINADESLDTFISKHKERIYYISDSSEINDKSIKELKTKLKKLFKENPNSIITFN